MPKASFSTVSNRVEFIDDKNKSKAKFENVSGKAYFSTATKTRLGFIKDLNTLKANFEDVSGSSKFTEILPFRVKFIQVEQASYNKNNPAPIGIAIVGLNNYVI